MQDKTCFEYSVAIRGRWHQRAQVKNPRAPLLQGVGPNDGATAPTKPHTKIKSFLFDANVCPAWERGFEEEFGIRLFNFKRNPAEKKKAALRNPKLDVRSRARF